MLKHLLSQENETILCYTESNRYYEWNYDHELLIYLQLICTVELMFSDFLHRV